MFKKLTTFMLALAIFTVQAQAAAPEGLKAAFDELTYTLSVDWDQRDAAVYEREMKAFLATVMDLQRAGLTNDEMIAFASTKVRDARIARDLQTAFSMITINKMSTEEASKYMLEALRRSSASGAAWTGDAVRNLGVSLLIVAIAVGVVLAVSSGSGGKNTGNSTGTSPSPVEGQLTCSDNCAYVPSSTCFDYNTHSFGFCNQLVCTPICY